MCDKWGGSWCVTGSVMIDVIAGKSPWGLEAKTTWAQEDKCHRQGWGPGRMERVNKTG